MRVSSGRRPVVALGLVMVAGAVLLLWEMRGQSLALDEWSFFADYRGHSPHLLAKPFADNLLVLPIVLYKLIYEAFGPDSVALRLVLIALNLTCAALFFELMRRRAGPWTAVGAATLLIVLGAASDIVAASLGIAILIATACGLGALLALERRDRAGDVIAAVLLVAALASNSHGIPFLVGAAVSVVFADPRPWLRRAWVFGTPLALYLLWRLWAIGEDPVGPSGMHPGGFGWSEIAALPTSVFDSLGSAATSVTGLYTAPSTPGPFDPVFGPVLAVAVLLAVAARLRAEPAPGRDSAVFAAMALSYWALIGVVGNDRLPEVPRYQYDGSIFLMLFAAAMASGVSLGRWRRRASYVVAAMLALSIGTNFAALHLDANFFRDRGEKNRAAFAAIEIARDHVDSDLMVEPIGAHLDPDSPRGFSGAIGDLQTDAYISAGRYLSAADDLGSAAFTQDELAAASPGARDYADRELAAALGLAPVPPSELPGLSPPDLRSCVRGRGGPGGADPITVPVEPGEQILVTTRRREPASIALRRFGPGYAAALTPVPAREAAVVEFPLDGSPQPWDAVIVGARIVCVAGP